MLKSLAQPEVYIEEDPRYPNVPIPSLPFDHNTPMWDDQPKIWFDLPPWWSTPVLYPSDYSLKKWPSEIPTDPKESGYKIPDHWPLDYNNPKKPWIPDFQETLYWPRGIPFNPEDPKFKWPDYWPRSPRNPKLPYFPRCPQKDPRFQYNPTPKLINAFEYPKWPFGIILEEYKNTPYVPKKVEDPIEKPNKQGIYDRNPDEGKKDNTPWWLRNRMRGRRGTKPQKVGIRPE